MSFHNKFSIKYVFHFYNYENTYMYNIVNKESSKKLVFCKTINPIKICQCILFFIISCEYQNVVSSESLLIYSCQTLRCLTSLADKIVI